MHNNILDQALGRVLLIGIALGIAICATIYGLYWLFSHIDITWV